MIASSLPACNQAIVPKIPAILDRAPQSWMQHPVWYMKPIHVLLRLMGVKKIIWGSTGHSGRDAAELLVDHLRQGYSTVLNPDGPNGPAFVIKKGILHLSLKSCVPVVPLRFSSSSFIELKTWDRKKFARPFSTIELNISEPIYVTSDNFEYVHDLIERKMRWKQHLQLTLLLQRTAIHCDRRAYYRFLQLITSLGNDRLTKMISMYHQSFNIFSGTTSRTGDPFYFDEISQFVN